LARGVLPQLFQFAVPASDELLKNEQPLILPVKVVEVVDVTKML
jgi:hypothetical protein